MPAIKSGRVDRRLFLKSASTLLAGLSIPLAPRASRRATSDGTASNRLPVLDYRTSWIGNTFRGAGANGFGRWVQDEINHLTVTPHGVVVTASIWDEAGRCTGLYRDGDVNRVLLRAGATLRNEAWGFGTAGQAVAVLDKTIFIINTTGDLLRFHWASPPDINGQITYRDHLRVGQAVAMAAVDRWLVVALANGEIQIRSPHDMKPLRSFSVPETRDVTVDSRGTLWLLVRDKIEPYDERGHLLAGAIRDAGKPTAIAIDRRRDQLIVCDNGPRQQVRVYQLTDLPKLVAVFGEAGGLRAGHPGQMAPDKLFALRGAGRDDAGNLYVGMCFGPQPNSPTLIRALDPEGKLRWEVAKYAWVTAFCFDPLSHGTMVYTPEAILSFHPGAPAGKQWKAEAITLDAVRYPDDPRIKGTDANSTTLRHLQGRRLLYTMGQYARGFDLYAFEPAPSQIAYHVGRIGDSGWAWSVDAEGGIWNGDAAGGKIIHYPFQQWSPEGKPVFHTQRPAVYPWPKLFTQVCRTEYVSSTDSLYASGYTPKRKEKTWGVMGSVLARYDGWRAGLPRLRWTVDLPLDERGYPPTSFSVVDDYIFTVQVYGGDGRRPAVTVFHTSNGAGVGRMAGRINGQYSLVDTRNAIHACRRCDGKYWIMVERDWRGKNVVYEWTPGQAGTRE